MLSKGLNLWICAVNRVIWLSSAFGEGARILHGNILQTVWGLTGKNGCVSSSSRACDLFRPLQHVSFLQTLWSWWLLSREQGCVLSCQNSHVSKTVHLISGFWLIVIKGFFLLLLFLYPLRLLHFSGGWREHLVISLYSWQNQDM